MIANTRARTTHYDVRITHDEDTDTVTIDTVPETHDVTIHNGSIVINIDEIKDAYFAPTRVILNGREILYGDVPLEWIQLTHHPKYGISMTAPYQIRNRTNRNVLTQSLSYMGYYQLSIDGKTCPIHRLVAEQFIHNDDPEHKTEVDHIDRNKINNTIENLRWVTHSENQGNKDKWGKQTSEYLDPADIDQDDMIQVGLLWDGIFYGRYYYNRAMDKLLLHQYADEDGERYKIVKPIKHISQSGSVVQSVTLMSDDIEEVPEGKKSSNKHNKGYNKLITYIKKREGLA